LLFDAPVIFLPRAVIAVVHRFGVLPPSSGTAAWSSGGTGRVDQFLNNTLCEIGTVFGDVLIDPTV
jgi:hypothetical protein